MPERRVTEDDVSRSNFNLARALRREAARFTGGTSGTGSGISGGTTGTTTTVVRRVMTALGDLIYGGEAGAERRLGIGTAGQVLTVTNVSGQLLPRWQDATASPTGDNVIDSSGDLITDSAGAFVTA